LFFVSFLLFVPVLSSICPGNRKYALNMNYFFHIEVMLLLCSQVYWLGDLNYRITELDPWRVKDCIESGNYLPLLKYDQLHQQHDLKSVFAGYQEGTITFRPTYKYDPGTDDWDSRYYIAGGCFTPHTHFLNLMGRVLNLFWGYSQFYSCSQPL